MKLSAQEEYGLRCLLRVARQETGASLTILEIAESEGLAPHNVAKYLRILRNGNFVDSERGQHGGYSLAGSAATIAVGDVLACLGGRLYDTEFCGHFSGAEEVCQHSSLDCSMRSLWARVQGAVDEVLGTTTLENLLHSVRAHEEPIGNTAAEGLLQVAASPCN